jgi:hypothetical protein
MITTEDISNYKVRGFFKPESSFQTIEEWEKMAKQFLELQSQGFDTRGGVVSDNPTLVKLINQYFGYQYYIEPMQFSKLDQKTVLDFIEDFVNYRVWEMNHDFSEHVPDITKARFAYFYSRGNIEPYILLDDNFTIAAYGSTNIETVSYHWTSREGLENIVSSIKDGLPIPLSTFTIQTKKFFRPESNYLVKLKGHLVAAFQSDTKSFSTDNGHKAANMFRFTLPGHQENLCTDWKACKQNTTYLWNEIIVNPTGIIDYKKVEKY